MQIKNNKKLFQYLFAIMAFINIALFSVAIFFYNIFIDTGMFKSFIPTLKTMYILNEYYVEKLDPVKLKENILSGLVNNLDPHSIYLPPSDLNDFNAELKGEYGGIGIGAKPSPDNKSLVVKDIMNDGPAFQAGIRLGQHIVKIDGKNVSESTLQENFKKIRGKIGSKVHLEVSLSNDKSDVKAITVTRKDITPPTVQWSISDNIKDKQILYLKVAQFNDETLPQTISAINKAKQNVQMPFTDIILDLRDNPGGFVNAAVGLAALFGEKDAVVVSAHDKHSDHFWLANKENWSTQSSSDQDPTEIFIKKNSWLKHIPLIVLVNRRSASASEIVAAALQDWKRASIVGNNTFGKGSIQTMISLGDNNGSLKITTSRYYTPNKHPIQAVGVKVDYPVKSILDFGYREADLPQHLASEAIKENKGNTGATPPNTKDIEASDEYIAHSERSTFSDQIVISEKDPYIQSALNLIGQKLKAD